MSSQSGFFALPIDPFRARIEESVAKNPVTIITAETGAGKSTRIPLWFWKQGKTVRVTQPRRIAARSLSQHLSRFTDTVWGQQIGYQTGYDRKTSRSTRLLYLTDGIQMINEVRGKRNYDILLLDEIHEWNLNQEILAGMVKKNLVSGYYSKTGKRVIVMSATLEAARLSAFFNRAPVISVPGRGFPVTMHCHSPEFLLSDTVQLVEAERNVLVFLPGKKEIQDFSDTLEQVLKEDKLKAKILPLHSEISVREQQRVFTHYPVPKVIIATDIAQTSLTIDDIDAVVDSGMKKEIRSRKGIEGLYPTDISRAECLQRAGRAGRVRNGQYILCSVADTGDRPDFPEPEIRRLNLESVVLRMIKWQIPPLDFPYFHDPKKNLIYKALSQLKIFGAITRDEKITEDGKKMAELPVSIRNARLCLEAGKGSDRVMDHALKVIAILENNGIAGREYQGELFYTGPYLSDVLNQLYMFTALKNFRKVLSQKKVALAREMLRELRERMQVKKTHYFPENQDLEVLFRALLSAFSDWIYIKSGSLYLRDEEERQLDRRSLLNQEQPDMVAGMPFDLMIQRDNPHTGETENLHLALITFASKISLAVLEKLKPYNYSHERTVDISKKALSVRHRILFSTRVITEFSAAPDYGNPEEMTTVADRIIEWVKKNPGETALPAHRERLKALFDEISTVIDCSAQDFPLLWDQFVKKEIVRHMKIDRIDLFCRLHRGFTFPRLDSLLPKTTVKRLMDAHWPHAQTIGNRSVRIDYSRGRPRIFLKPDDFAAAEKEDLVSHNGSPFQYRLLGRNLRTWEQGVHVYNVWKKKEIYLKRWRSQQKPARMEDLEDIEFPVAFEGGRGKMNQIFEFHSVPLLSGDDIFLIHFETREKALDHFASIRSTWEQKVREFKQKKLGNMFAAKGWKVKK